MTNPTPHGQVPEALRLAHIFDNPLPPEWPDMVAAAAELRRQHARIAELEAQIKALSGVQALRAAPAGWKLVPVEPTGVMLTAAEIAIAGAGKTLGRYNAYAAAYSALLAASPTPSAEQKAAPKAVPGEPSWWRKRADEIEAQVALTGSPEAMRCYTDMRTLLQAAAEEAPQQEAQEPTEVPYQKLTNEIDLILSDPDTELSIGAKRALWWMRTWVSVPLYTAPQPAPAPLSDDVVKDAARWRMVALIGNEVMQHPEKRTQAAAVKAYMDATHSGLDLTGAVDAALAAQGGKV